MLCILSQGEFPRVIRVLIPLNLYRGRESFPAEMGGWSGKGTVSNSTKTTLVIYSFDKLLMSLLPSIDSDPSNF